MTPLRVSSTPTPLTATDSKEGRPLGLSLALSTATGSVLGRSRLLYCMTMGSSGSSSFSRRFSRRLARLARFASSMAACESATNTTPSAPFSSMRRVAS